MKRSDENRGFIRSGSGKPRPPDYYDASGSLATGGRICHCRRCQDEWLRKMSPGKMAHAYCTMTLCPDCGNKRCPKATDHRNDCTGSNEPGQPGSDY